MRRTFLTIPEELLEIADSAADDFSDRGFTIKVEYSEISYPYTPAFVAKRGSTTVIVEVDTDLPNSRMDEWSRYAGSCSRDTGVAVAVPGHIALDPAIEDQLRQKGVGIYRVTSSGVVELAPPKDLALLLKLPERNTLHQKVRRVLARAYEKFSRAEWREGFEEACKVLEEEARRYLKKGLATGRIVVLDKRGKPRRLTDKTVDRMTMGVLQEAFANIQNQNRVDSLVGEALQEVIKDRNSIVHHKGRATTESKLRKNVGQHMWTIVAGLKAILTAKT